MYKLTTNILSELMTPNPVVIPVNTLMTKVKEVFDNNNFHHLPVVNADEESVGIISLTDMRSLENQYTLLGVESAAKKSKGFLESLIVDDVMRLNPVSINVYESIDKAIDLFMNNQYHSILVEDNNKCIGILTPFDFIKKIKNEK